MATMNVSLPDQMKEWVEAQAENGRYSNASDYVRDLIRRDQVKTEKIAAMQAVVTKSIASGYSDLSPEELFEKIRTRTLRPVDTVDTAD
jgi:antitoxin ParD1/3/4